MSLLYKYLIIPLFLMPAASSVGVAVGASVISTIISFFQERVIPMTGSPEALAVAAFQVRTDPQAADNGNSVDTTSCEFELTTSVPEYAYCPVTTALPAPASTFVGAAPGCLSAGQAFF